jgi:hypothetical protein
MERCDYSRDRKAAAFEDEGCWNEAVVSLADGHWHLCAECAALPEFKRYRKRVPLPPATTPGGEEVG